MWGSETGWLETKPAQELVLGRLRQCCGDDLCTGQWAQLDSTLVLTATEPHNLMRREQYWETILQALVLEHCFPSLSSESFVLMTAPVCVMDNVLWHHRGEAPKALSQASPTPASPPSAFAKLSWQMCWPSALTCPWVISEESKQLVPQHLLQEGNTCGKFLSIHPKIRPWNLGKCLQWECAVL